MSKKPFDPKNPNKQHNYELKSDAVDALVNADTEEVPQYSKEELGKYRTHRSIELPELVKVLILKTWFPGAVCYFILWGLGAYVSSNLDMLFIVGVVLGMVTDLLTNNILRFMETTPGDSNRWLLVTHKGMVGFGLNLFWGLVIVLCVFFLYEGINYLAALVTGDPTRVFLAVEPFFYGVFCMGFDMLFLGIKHLLGAIFRDAMDSARRK